MPPKGFIRNDEECTIILQKVDIRTERDGFEINPYDPCIVNKMINGSQMTVRWHVDDLTISHNSNEAISQFLRVLTDIYGDNLAENTEKVHDYLLRIFDF